MTREIFGTTEAQSLARLLKEQFKRRLERAMEECIVSEHNGMRLTRYTETSGNRFVKRELSRHSDVAQNNRFVEFDGNLGDAFRTFTSLLSEGPVSIVPSSLIKDDLDGLIILSEHRDDVAGLEVASPETKAAVACQLISLASLDNKYHIGLESLQADMFNVYLDPNSVEKVELLDIDPYLGRNFMPESSFFSRYPDNNSRGAYVGRVINLFWDKWCKTGEDKELVFLAVTKAIGELMPDEEDWGFHNPLFTHLSVAQIMKSGLDTRY